MLPGLFKPVLIALLSVQILQPMLMQLCMKLLDKNTYQRDILIIDFSSKFIIILYGILVLSYLIGIGFGNSKAESYK